MFYARLPAGLCETESYLLENNSNFPKRTLIFCGVLSKWQVFFIKMRAAFLAPILPWVMKEGESKKAALILMKNSPFDRTLR